MKERRIKLPMHSPCVLAFQKPDLFRERGVFGAGVPNEQSCVQRCKTFCISKDFLYFINDGLEEKDGMIPN